MRGLGSDHVISGPMRSLKKTAPVGANRQTEQQTDRQGNSITEPPSGSRLDIIFYPFLWI